MKQPMKNKLILITGAAMCFALAPITRAQTVDGSVLYTPNVNLSTISQNGFAGYVGGVFLTSFNYFPEVNALGFADPTGAPLTDSHVVSLFDNSNGNALLASVTVPAGNAAPLIDGYRWVQLPSTVNLTYNNYYIILAQVGQDNNADIWGNNIANTAPDGTPSNVPGANASNGQITWSGQYVNSQQGYEFSRDGVYSSDANPADFNRAGGTDDIYSAPNLGFNVIPAPEPGSVALLGVGAALFAGLALKRKANKRSA